LQEKNTKVDDPQRRKVKVVMDLLTIPKKVEGERINRTKIDRQIWQSKTDSD